MGISKVTRNFQVTLPKDVRKMVGVKEGDEIIFQVDGNKVTFVKVDDDIIRKTAGSWKDIKESGVDFQRRIRKESEKRLRRLYGSR